MNKIPKLIRWIFLVTATFFISMLLFRIIFYWRFQPRGTAFSGSAFIMGLRFDMRIACIVGLAILLLAALPFLNPFKNNKSKLFWNIFLPIIFVIMVLVYLIDFYHFDYLHQRLNATALSYLQDAGISFNMMWQTYPLIKMLIALIVFFLLTKYVFAKLLNKIIQQNSVSSKKGLPFYIVLFFILVAFIFGKLGQYPLRWSDAFALNDDFKANFALNPFQSFFSSLSFRNSSYDAKKVKEYYPLMASYLGVKNTDSAHLNYKRNFVLSDSSSAKPNVILVICESFSAYKSSMYGNPLNTTPYFNELCKNGVFFDRCFTPAYGTARGVWATITGIPDVESPNTASRNPGAVNQQTIINDFTNYDKYYFLGGNATWANIRGLLTNNINGLHLYEQDDYKAPKLDVWGISDKNLFLEANKVLKTQAKPFFAIIQTADNHRPYTIPKEDEEMFKKISFEKDTLKKYGFDNNDELNAFRFTDYCYQKFIETAKQEKYFDNTIFIFVGDHGITGNAGNMFPKTWTENGLTAEHVPLLFYAPKLLQPQKVHQVCSQVDILPSAAFLAKTTYSNNTFGRNLFDTTNNNLLPQEKFAFITDPNNGTIGLISNAYYFYKNLKTRNDNFVSMINNNSIEKNNQTDSAKKYLSKLTEAYYQTAKYLLLNNKK